MIVVGDGEIRLPALTTAHSHAFQRGMRGTVQRATKLGRGDFWSWRDEMFHAAMALTPESIAKISRVAFEELARAGVRTVGEFHYIHHQADGTPYDDRTIMSDVVIEAAKAAGLRIALLRVAYHRAGPWREAEPGQKRFCDANVDSVIRDVEKLCVKYNNDPDVRIGIAPHSVRAVPPEWIPVLAKEATKRGLPFHMHVAEQQREVDECIAETGKRPVELIAESGGISPRFVAVHATQLLPNEAELLGRERAFVCICATTERDLGDGLPDLGSLRAFQTRLCVGIDSHVVTDPFDDVRALETHERLRTRKRITFTPQGGISPAQQLWKEGSIEGAQACGFSDAGGELVIRRDHPTLALVEEEDLLDAIVFSGGPSLVSKIVAR
jgi:formimidoylglutamate deiminase